MSTHTASTRAMVVLFSAGDHRAMATALQELAHTRSMGFESHPAEMPDPDAVFARWRTEAKRPALVVFGGSHWQAGNALDTPPEAWDAAWRSQCLAGAQVGQAAIRAFRAHRPERASASPGAESHLHHHTLIFLGHADSVTDAQPARRRAPAAFGAAHAAAGAGLRSLAQSMARGFGPDGIHVAHLGIDGPLPLSVTAADSVAQACWSLHAQGRSAWSQDIDLRVTHTPEATHDH